MTQRTVNTYEGQDAIALLDLVSDGMTPEQAKPALDYNKKHPAPRLSYDDIVIYFELEFSDGRYYTAHNVPHGLRRTGNKRFHKAIVKNTSQSFESEEAAKVWIDQQNEKPWWV